MVLNKPEEGKDRASSVRGSEQPIVLRARESLAHGEGVAIC